MTPEQEVPDPVELIEIVRLAQAGDKPALDRLLRYAAVRARPYLRAFSGGRNASLGDLSQQVLFVVWSGIRRLDDPGRFESWLAGIVRNRCLDELRRHYRRAKAYRRAGTRGLELSTEDPVLAAARKDVVAQVRRAIGRLPDRYREVIELRHLKGFSCREIAAMTGKPEGTVSSLCKRGRARLRELLERRGELE
jgi:RNA polymerase sigma-70 factor (ECF subfamily)